MLFRSLNYYQKPGVKQIAFCARAADGEQEFMFEPKNIIIWYLVLDAYRKSRLNDCECSDFHPNLLFMLLAASIPVENAACRL